MLKCVVFFSLLYLVFFLSLRISTYCIIRENMNLSAYKKVKKGQNIIESFTFSKYKDRIPQWWLRYYWKTIFEYFVSVIISLIIIQNGVDETLPFQIALLEKCIEALILRLYFIPRKNKTDDYSKFKIK